MHVIPVTMLHILSTTEYCVTLHHLTKLQTDSAPCIKVHISCLSKVLKICYHTTTSCLKKRPTFGLL